MEESTKRPTRRDFIQTAIAVSGVGVVSSLIGLQANAESRAKKGAAPAAAAGEAVCEPGKGMAGGMNYHHKHADVKDAKLKMERSGVAWDKQFCDNCSFYTATSGGKGKCSVIQGCAVEAKGICSTWAKKV